MRTPVSLAALLLLCAAHAAAQVRTAAGEAAGAVPAAFAVPVIGGAAAAPLSFTGAASLTPALSPSLSAPSIAPAASAAAALSPKTGEFREFQGLTPEFSAPAALKPVLAAPSKADEGRAAAAKAVAEWKASKAAASGAKTDAPVPAAAEILAANLDSMFDGRMPTSAQVLGRAGDLDLSEAALGVAISESATPVEAAAKLQALGVIGSKEAGLAATDEDGFRVLLTRLWKAAASKVPSSIPVDSSWSVPALKVERGGVIYYVHGVTHGQYGAPRRGAVLKLVREVAKAGGSLYSEQNLPAHYGYTAGRETLDHRAADGYPVTVTAAAPGFNAVTLVLKRAVDWAVSPGSLLGSIVWAVIAHGALSALASVAVTAVLAWVILTGGLPLMRLKRRRRAAAARADGLEDLAAQYADEARDFFVAKPDLEVLRSLELPQPLGAQEGDPYSIRSRAIADAVAADAAAGAQEVHVVVGHLHAHETAWRLAQPGERKS